MKFLKTASILLVLLACYLALSTAVPLDGRQALIDGGKKGAIQNQNPFTDAEIAIKIIPAANRTFGYDILLEGKAFIHQPNIPGLPGNEGFGTKKRAQNVAEFVVKKIRKNEMPPTMTIEDLNMMGVLK